VVKMWEVEAMAARHPWRVVFGSICLLWALSSYFGTGASDATPDVGVRALLGSGDGHDWVRLSESEKASLCRLIAERLDRHSGWYYLNFLDNLYSDDHTLNTDIAEAAAIAAALD
jgi:hypothetical protein